MEYLAKDDPALAALVKKEEDRLDTTLNLIAAENHSPLSILDVMGSVFNTKTIEGYPGNRFHAGCRYVDEVEKLAIERGKALFGADCVNVQPHSGTSANLAVYFASLKVGDRILSMSLPHGGHLSHGHTASMTSKCFNFKHYSIDPDTERLDYEAIHQAALAFKPKMIVAGASSYPRLIDYKKMGEIAKEVSALLLADIAHLAGLVAAGVIPSPVPHCDFVTFTSYKTLMGGRGGIILSQKKWGKKIDRSVFPGCQGTSAVNLLAAKALIFKLAQEDKFTAIQQQTLENAKTMAAALAEKGYRIVTGGTDNHQVVIDLANKGISGKAAEAVLESVGLVANRNVVPKDAQTPGKVSGLRLGTGALAARGMGKAEVLKVVDCMDTAMMNPDDTGLLEEVKKDVLKLCSAFPVRAHL